MLELGELSRKLHEQVGDHLARCKVAHEVLVGNESKVIAGRLSAATDGYLADDIVNAADYIVRLVDDVDTVLIKASRGMALERVLMRLRETLNG
ncbi:MAG: UDP-N-acetylmuramoyl-tripeptide--D-alanyl-D-alanine ligase, partial [bacterium]|nr:UDP-N-acetylmuramoyl-tripeptide--D-alanyl-D-alanine ligase [bacterium]